MIAAVRANQPGFREVRFGEDLNLIYAERTKESTKKDSRNGLGKSTVLDIVHFCLGGKGTPDSGVVRDALADWTFSVDLRLGGTDITLTRAVRVPRKIQWAVGGDHHGVVISVDEANRRLGALMFNLGGREETGAFAPTFRSLFSYLARRGSAAYLDPFSHHRNQQAWDQQVNVAYHLDLNWQDARRAQGLRDEKKIIATLKKAAKSSSLISSLGSAGELEVERVRLKESVESQRTRLQSFRVHEDYRSIEAEANSLTEQIHRLSNENVEDLRFLQLFRAQLAEESTPNITPADITGVFAELQVVLPEQVTRRLAEVEAFHEAVVHNRREFLAAEIHRLERVVGERDLAKAQLDERRAEILDLLRTHGALEEYQAHQARLTEVEGRLADVEARIARLRELTDASNDFAVREQEFVRTARLHYDELADQRDKAIAQFNANTEALYQAPGSLIIDVDRGGFTFKVEINRADSEGVSNMKIFCFDLMIMQLWADRDGGPGFLIHDSTLFDPVDERQTASALMLARSEAEKRGFQYICAMNSDAFPTAELPDGFLSEPEIAVRLTDTTDDGMLLGRRF